MLIGQGSADFCLAQAFRASEVLRFASWVASIRTPDSKFPENLRSPQTPTSIIRSSVGFYASGKVFLNWAGGCRFVWLHLARREHGAWPEWVKTGRGRDWGRRETAVQVATSGGRSACNQFAHWCSHARKIKLNDVMVDWSKQECFSGRSLAVVIVNSSGFNMPHGSSL